jgi:alkylhydroperoxidase family enzyme
VARGDPVTAPRLPLLSAEDAKAAAGVAGVPELVADLNVFRIWLHHPPLARWFSDLLMGLLWEGQLDARLRELVIMRLGWATGSDYEWTQHWRIALSVGVTDDDLLAVRDWRSSDRFGDAERAVLAATDETIADGAITAATWESCRTHVSDDPRVLLELVSAIGVWRMVSGILRSLDVPLEDGVASWPPDGRAP